MTTTATIVSMPSPPPSPVAHAKRKRDAAADDDGGDDDDNDDGLVQKPYIVNKAVRKTKCRGSKKTCAHDNQIEKGQVRFGTRGDVDGRDQVFWRHLECVTARMLTNMRLTPSTLSECIDFCTNDGTKMAITDDETVAAMRFLSTLCGGGGGGGGGGSGATFAI